MLVMANAILFVIMMFRRGISAANGQLVTPGWVWSTVVTRSDPLVSGNLIRFMLVSIPSLRATACRLFLLFSNVKFGVPCVDAVSDVPLSLLCLLVVMIIRVLVLIRLVSILLALVLDIIALLGMLSMTLLLPVFVPRLFLFGRLPAVCCRDRWRQLMSAASFLWMCRTIELLRLLPLLLGLFSGPNPLWRIDMYLRLLPLFVMCRAVSLMKDGTVTGSFGLRVPLDLGSSLG